MDSILENGSKFGTKKVLNFKEVCEYTGWSASHLYKLTSGRKIPHYSPGGKMLMFKLDELEEWLLQGKRASKEEIGKELEALSL